MGKVSTPAYRIEMRGYERVHFTPSGWDYKRLGKPNDSKLADYVASLENSTKPGGVNAHLGFTPIASAAVVRQSSGDVIARYRGPSFIMF